MPKKKSPKPSSHNTSIANKIISDIKKISGRKVLNLEEIRKGHQMAEDLEASVASDKELARLDPLHAMYVFALNRLDILAAQLTQLPACHKLFSALAAADDIYMPSFPPMSPVTRSYFSCWSFLDFEVGNYKESLAKIAIRISQALSSHQNLITLYQRMQESRMGLYVHQGTKKKRIILKELITEKEFNCISPSGYIGTSGELWFARIFPEPFPDRSFGYSVVFTTPYVIGKVEKGFFKNTGILDEWQLFFERTLGKTGETDRIKTYEQFMKYGLRRHYWNEYIFKSYANYTDHVVYLTGIPDRPETLPHAD
ncbi:MAG: hypothetical protein K9K79_10040 [Desulfohalobiaceae bacterium]|nr:hypothetical protein [Desulfohalobiaceae bacterium]